MESKFFRRKLLLFFLGFVAIFVLLAIRLVDVQIRQGKNFYQQAEANRYFIKKEKTERAVFLDRYQQPLVENQKVYYELEKPNQIYSNKKYIPSDQALAVMATESAQLSYDFNRIYPYKEALAHVLGYLTPVTADDLAVHSDLPLDESLGRLGLEKYFDDILHSQAATKKYEVNALGQTQKMVEYQSAIFGENIPTTLDPYLSLMAYKAMKNQKGAVVVMDAQTGEVLVLLSSPSFDPNVFEQNYLAKLQMQQGLPVSAEQAAAAQTLQNYLQDPNQVFFNRAISGTYPPGSIFKLVTALGALQEGDIDQNSQVNDEGVLKVGDYEYNNWYYTQYGRVEGQVNVQKAIARSNDIFFYKTAEWLGPDKLAQYARLFSYGQKINLQLENIGVGLVPDPQWKEQQRGEPWYLGNTYHFGIGQGDLLVTPLQVAQMTQALANHGNLCPATLVESAQKNCQSLAIKEDNLALVLSGMLDACSTGGTAYPLFPYNTRESAQLLAQDPSFGQLPAGEKITHGLVACKTGTAEFGEANAQGYRKTHAWTTAIVGVDQARLQADEQQVASDSAQVTATASAQASESAAIIVQKNAQLSDRELRQQWLKNLAKGGVFPKELAITVLVESDETDPYKEGSDDAAPVILQLLNWITGNLPN